MARMERFDKMTAEIVKLRPPVHRSVLTRIKTPATRFGDRLAGLGANLSIFAKATLLIFLCTASVALVPAIQSSREIDSLASSKVAAMALVANETVAEQISGPVKFKKTDKIEEVFENLIARNDQDILAVTVITLGDETLATQGDISDAIRAELDALAKETAFAGASVVSQDGFLIASPVTFGSMGETIGVVASVWTPDNALADVAREKMITWITAFVLFAGLMLAANLLIRLWISRPIVSLTRAMKSVSDGDLDTVVPFIKNGDEIGTIARALEDQRKKLAAARLADEQVQAAAKTIAAKEAEQRIVVENLNTGLKALANGDLASRIETPFDSDYETLRQNFNKSLDELRSTILSVAEDARSIRDGAEQINASTDDLSQRTETQAATLEQTVAALEELTASITSSADGAQNVARIVMSARDDAEKSGTVVSDAVAAMTEIQNSSAEIGQIIGVIDEIAFQTNLLALNAGVEAARAGDAGRGFAVVATEVRALAQRSADAAQKIKELIRNSGKQVDHGVDLVHQTGEVLSSIVAQVAEISDHVTNIAGSAEEQSSGLNEINIGVGQLDLVTQKNAAMVGDVNEAVRTQTAKAKQLTGLVTRFRTDRHQHA